MNVTRNLSFKRTLLLTVLLGLGFSPSLHAKLIAKSSGNTDSGNNDNISFYVINPDDLIGYDLANNQNGIVAATSLIYSAPTFTYDAAAVFATPYDDCGPAVLFYDEQGNPIYAAESECAYEFEVGEDILIQGRSNEYTSEAYTTFYRVGIRNNENDIIQSHAFTVDNGTFENLFRWDELMLDPGDYSVVVSLEMHANKLPGYTKFAYIDTNNLISLNDEIYFSVTSIYESTGTANSSSLTIVPATAASLPVSEPWPLGLWLLPLSLWGLQRRLRR